MRILAVIVNLVPYHAARWAAVARQGHAVTLLQRRAGDPFAVLRTEADHAPFQLHTLTDPAAGAERWREQLLGWIDRAAPQVVVVSGYGFPESLAALLAAAERRLPVVVCSESNRHDAPRRFWSETLKRRLLRHAQAALVGGDPQAAYLEGLGMPAAAIFRGYNAVDNSHFAAGRRWRRHGDAARRRLGLPPRYLLAVSRFTAKKNLVTLIEGFHQWRRQVPPDQQAASLLILGDGPLRPELEARIVALGLQEQVLLPGACAYADLPSRYALAEGFIHASTVEQWGLVVNEAMAAGLPVLVSSACGCAPALVHPGVNGLRFDPASPAAIAHAITWLLAQSPAARSRMGRASRRIVAAHGPQAFAAGLQAAAAYAVRQPVEPLSRIDRALLERLIQRTARLA
jgi:glycosyltransferase involved in cell wall biosynthesis